ncbi:MAG: polyphosphate polymerase domain-containing protein [Bacteroidetes bacterium]|nr:MAG: polyphosphate polymerase domain-containing protein [Bacteroidota bacterium]
MPALSSVIAKFEPITLSEMENVKLMERTDSKYVFSREQLPEILDAMNSSYRLLEINNMRQHRYESLYYDTKDFQLFKRHHLGRLNRWKLRFRKYVDSGGLTFFEIKFKNRKETTIKNRVKMKEVGNTIEGKAMDFMKEITPFAPENFEPKMWVNYSRMTFVNKFMKERLTIDTDLHFKKALADGKVLEARFPGMVIAEAKRGKASSVSEFIRMVRLNGIRESGISKYCFGIYNLFDSVKKNNFKPRVRFIHKMAGMPFYPTGT